MATKLYVDGLRLVAQSSHRYATHWQTQLQANLTGPQYTALLAFIVCVADLLTALGSKVIVP